MTDTDRALIEGLEQEPDMSWIDIAILRNGGQVIADFSPGWAEFFDSLDIFVEDCIETSVTMPTEVGMYRWSGYTLGYWDEGDDPNIKGGTFVSRASAKPHEDEGLLRATLHLAERALARARQDISSGAVKHQMITAEHAVVKALAARQ